MRLPSPSRASSARSLGRLRSPTGTALAHNLQFPGNPKRRPNLSLIVSLPMCAGMVGDAKGRERSERRRTGPSSARRSIVMHGASSASTGEHCEAHDPSRDPLVGTKRNLPTLSLLVRPMGRRARARGEIIHPRAPSMEGARRSHRPFLYGLFNEIMMIIIIGEALSRCCSMPEQTQRRRILLGRQLWYSHELTHP